MQMFSLALLFIIIVGFIFDSVILLRKKSRGETISKGQIVLFVVISIILCGLVYFTFI